MRSGPLERGASIARQIVCVLGLAGLLVMPQWARAIPLFHRQTGQNCVACHAGGQFPELTPYGRLFKLTGYTLGQRTIPLAAMAVATVTRVANTSKSDDPGTDFAKNDRPILASASLFTGGRITDNIGAFAQVTYDPYAIQAADGSLRGRTNVDNVDIRYADRFVGEARDLIVGLSLDNNPSVSDPWNTAAAWMQYVPVPSPGSSRFIDGTAPYPGFAAGGNIAGLTGYAFLNRTWYAEAGLFGNARGPLSFMHGGLKAADQTRLRGLNPYGRLAWNREWGPHSLMLGAAAMGSGIYDDPLATGDPATVHHYRDRIVDLQYQYLLDPHATTVQFVVGHSSHRYPGFQADQPVAFVSAAGQALPLTSRRDTSDLWRLKLSYVYQARVGVSAALFSLRGNTNTALQTSGFDPATLKITSDPNAAAPSQRVSGNLTGNPGTRGQTLEAFCMPLQNMRVGLQSTTYGRYNGAARNYDGFGRNAHDNDSLLLYVWSAF